MSNSGYSDNAQGQGSTRGSRSPFIIKLDKLGNEDEGATFTPLTMEASERLHGKRFLRCNKEGIFVWGCVTGVSQLSGSVVRYRICEVNENGAAMDGSVWGHALYTDILGA